MSRSIHLKPHLNTAELGSRYRSAQDAIERGRWQFFWLLACGFSAKADAQITLRPLGRLSLVEALWLPLEQRHGADEGTLSCSAQ